MHYFGNKPWVLEPTKWPDREVIFSLFFESNWLDPESLGLGGARSSLSGSANLALPMILSRIRAAVVHWFEAARELERAFPMLRGHLHTSISALAPAR